MTVHLFGTAPSPACSNFALRKTAEDRTKDVCADVLKTVIRKICVDDCLKPVSAFSQGCGFSSRQVVQSTTAKWFSINKMGQHQEAHKKSRT